MFQFMFTVTSIFIFFVVIFIFATVFINIRKQINSGVEPTQNIKPVSNNKHDSKLKDCAYCGSPVKIDATECESCGGKEFKKHN